MSENPLRLPDLLTQRLLIRDFRLADLDAVYHLLDGAGSQQPEALEARRQWLEWTLLAYEQLANMYQFPYGDRAVTLRATGELVGVVGYTPSLGPFGQLPGYAGGVPAGQASRMMPEVGLFYAVAPSQRQKGIASEAAQALLDYAFQILRLRRVVATTEYDNLASQAVMRRLGMRLEHNPRPEPAWFQVVGILDAPSER